MDEAGLSAVDILKTVQMFCFIDALGGGRAHMFTTLIGGLAQRYDLASSHVLSDMTWCREFATELGSLSAHDE